LGGSMTACELIRRSAIDQGTRGGVYASKFGPRGGSAL
jgi:hypothetical protein